MVANQPVERPDSSDFLVNRIAALEAQVDALGRQSKYPFSVSHNGTPDFTILPNPNGPGALVNIYDGAGDFIFQTDSVAGYGIANPSMSILMGADFSAASGNTQNAGVEVSAAVAYPQPINPAIGVQILIIPTQAFSARLKATDGTTTVFSSATVYPTNANVYFSKIILLPQSMMNSQTFSLSLLITPAVNMTYTVWPQKCQGCSKALYDLVPSLH